MEWIYSKDEIRETAKAVWDAAGEKKVLAFYGQMGSGKTTFIHAMCDAKSVRDTVGSPTFSIINEYAFEENGKEKMIYHIDLYRLRDEQEAIQAGVEDCLYSDHTCLVEWPEKIPHLLPEDALSIYITVVNETTRRLQLGNN